MGVVHVGCVDKIGRYGLDILKESAEYSDVCHSPIVEFRVADPEGAEQVVQRASGGRHVSSRRCGRANRKDPAVYPQDADCAVVYKEPGTYTLTVTIHWRAWRWETGPWPNRPKLEVTDELPPEHATTSASVTVGVCELHTIPTHRPPKPGPPKPGTPRSCIDGDIW